MTQVTNRNYPIYNQTKSFQHSQPPAYYGTNYPYPTVCRPAKNNETTDTAGKVIFLQALTYGLNALSDYCSKKLSSAKEFTSAQNIVDTASDMVRKNKLNVNIGFIDELNKDNYASIYGGANEFDVVAKGKNAFYSNELKLAVAPKSKPSMILHELGHAINAKNTFTKLLQKSRRYAIHVPTALLIANQLTKNPYQKEKSFIEKHAVALGFCAFLPTIAEEALASLRGIKAAKGKLGNIANLSILKKNYALALCTYIMSGIGLGIASKQTIES